MSRMHKWKLDGVERSVLKCTKMMNFHLLNQYSEKVPIVVSIHRANSVTWNPHKMMAVPLQCSALLVREEVQGQRGDIPITYIFITMFLSLHFSIRGLLYDPT